jgi:mono/diheme cytochrome c family protein
MKLKITLPLLALTFAVFAAETNNPATAPAAAGAQIQRGKYLVENVAVCAECHTPKTDKGDYDRTQWLAGNLLDFKPTVLMPFAAVAPPIAGMPGFTDEQALKFLETGIDLTGKRAMPPMPPYRFNHDDALAVLAYLRSLKH